VALRGKSALAGRRQGFSLVAAFVPRVAHCDVEASQATITLTVAGRLNPENTNPAFAGRDLVSALGEINAARSNTVLATSPISDKPTIATNGTF